MANDDRVIRGVGYALLSQITAFGLGFVATIVPSFSWSALPYVLSSWGLTQWLVLAPLIRKQRTYGNSRTVQGIIITGCLGSLLSSACAYAFRPR